MDRISKVLPPLTAATPAREVKIYMQEGMWRAVQEELVKCGCTMTGFVRQAVAAEIARRRGEHKLRGRDEK